MTRRFSRPLQRSSKEDRTYAGRTYASKAERLYAEYLDALVKLGEVFRWLPQPNFHLTPDISFRPDFIVTCQCFYNTTAGADGCVRGGFKYEDTYVVDVKGYAQVGWTKKRKLWLKYATIRMLVVERKSNSWATIEVIDPREESCS